MKFHQISQAVLLLIQRWMSNEHMVFCDTLFFKKKNQKLHGVFLWMAEFINTIGLSMENDRRAFVEGNTI